jgi:hypothetical protein
MNGKITAVDGFYPNPDFVREYALSQDFDVSGNYPGARTGPQLDPYFQSQKLIFEKILGKEITYWPEEYNSAFQVTYENAHSWIHYDATEWAAVVYLHPDPVTDAGTAIYRHKETGIFKHEEGQRDFNEEVTDISDWEVIMETKNIYNRALLYNGKYYHSSVKPGFGDNKHNGRLFQTFFFDT